MLARWSAASLLLQDGPQSMEGCQVYMSCVGASGVRIGSSDNAAVVEWQGVAVAVLQGAPSYGVLAARDA